MILIINKSQKLADSVSDMLYFMEIISTPATPTEALIEYSPLYRGTILLNPRNLYDEPELIELLRGISPMTPIFCHGETLNEEIYDARFPSSVSVSEMISEMKAYNLRHGFNQIGEYENYTVKYENCLFTRTEKMILKLFAIYGEEPLSAAKILKYAFRTSRTPDISSVRTHISIINKKCMINYGRKLISTSIDSRYKLIQKEETEKAETV